MASRLKKIRGAEVVEVHTTERGDWTGETWRVPVAAVLPRNTRKGRPMTEPQRQALRRAHGARTLAAVV